MKTTTIYYYILASLLLIPLVACTENLDEEGFEMSDTEVINGFEVKWREFMTTEQRQVVRGILSDMVHVEGGVFTMGTNPNYDPDARVNEQPAHLVKLTDYYICAHELTYDHVQVLLELPTTRSSSIYEFNNKHLYYSWDDWKYVLDMLSDFSGIDFSFPSEAQWEFAAKGGTLSKGYLYPGSNDWNKIYADDLNDIDDTVPNELGIYNMANRRGEWCADIYNEYSDGPMPTNPITTIGLLFHLDEHVVRGGCHISTGNYKGWLSTSSPTINYSSVCEDMRMCRSTSRSASGNKSWDISCRPVINIK